MLPRPLSWIWGGPQGWEVTGRRVTGEEVRGRKGKDTGKERAENGRGTIPVVRGWRVISFSFSLMFSVVYANITILVDLSP